MESAKKLKETAVDRKLKKLMKILDLFQKEDTAMNNDNNDTIILLLCIIMIDDIIITAMYEM